ncbi:MAG: TPM domain-containing protein [Bacteroidetes bacterium]|nr:TPM domain-containing protein [Bacteroidota bacterium]
MLPQLFGRSRSWIDPAVATRVEAAIRLAERQTSGEIRVFTERRCSFVDAVDRAAELFAQLAMHQTEQRNAVLIYWAVLDRQVAVFADQEIHEKLGSNFWAERVEHMLPLFRSADPAAALEDCIQAVGEALQKHFPYDQGSDRNELSDNLMIGR